jgi:hypothetical protein
MEIAMRPTDELTAVEIENQYRKIRSAAFQSWVTIVVVCALGVAFVGAPVVFVAVAAVHTAGLPLVLSYARRWRRGLLPESSKK